MKVVDIKDRISEMCSHFIFSYHEKNCGIDPISQNHFDMWCGDDGMIATTIDEVMNVPFFDGKSLEEIAESIEVTEM